MKAPETHTAASANPAACAAATADAAAASSALRSLARWAQQNHCLSPPVALPSSQSSCNCCPRASWHRCCRRCRCHCRRCRRCCPCVVALLLPLLPSLPLLMPLLPLCRGTAAAAAAAATQTWCRRCHRWPYHLPLAALPQRRISPVHPICCLSLPTPLCVPGAQRPHLQ